MFYFFFRLLFFKGTCFKFYLIAVLICYLYFIIYRGAHNVFGTLWRCLFWPSLLQVALYLARNETWVVPEKLCSLRWCVEELSTFKESCLINFWLFSLLLFYLYIGNFLTTILSHVLGTRRDFWDGYQLKDIDGYQYQLTVINWRSLAVFAEISILDVWRGSLIRLCVGG